MKNATIAAMCLFRAIGHLQRNALLRSPISSWKSSSPERNADSLVRHIMRCVTTPKVSLTGCQCFHLSCACSSPSWFGRHAPILPILPGTWCQMPLQNWCPGCVTSQPARHVRFIGGPNTVLTLHIQSTKKTLQRRKVFRGFWQIFHPRACFGIP